MAIRSASSSIAAVCKLQRMMMRIKSKHTMQVDADTCFRVSASAKSIDTVHGGPKAPIKKFCRKKSQRNKYPMVRHARKGHYYCGGDHNFPLHFLLSVCFYRLMLCASKDTAWRRKNTTVRIARKHGLQVDGLRIQRQSIEKSKHCSKDCKKALSSG